MYPWSVVHNHEIWPMIRKSLVNIPAILSNMDLLRLQNNLS